MRDQDLAMNDETTEENEDETGPVGGERLRLARRGIDISVGDIAKELHLDEQKVRALERNEFDVLGAPVFAKGHLRKYAELVGVDVDDVMADYYRMNRSVGAPPVVGPRRKVAREIAPGPWIAAAAVIIVVVTAATLWFRFQPAEPESAIEPATLAPFTSSEQSAPSRSGELLPAEDVPEGTTEALTAPVNEAPATQIEPPVTSSQTASPSAAPQVEINLVFTGDCWTEVSDASGRRLFYDLGQVGRVVTLSGDAPLRVILGDSANVNISINGRDYPIPASAQSGRLARLDIDGQ